ncbi:MAG TPA: type II toxin-antitoxin system VapB family antitoxin [Thermoanaerobaculia bacterium]|jgi:Arc/MetJ family transcription regulator|nr:type II toxin-antitoxin system VapB family antitoxin [Thermoanaerobaculia bacterium]
MRINVVVDEKLILKAMGLTGLRTYKAAIHEAMTALVGLYEQGEVRGLRGKLHCEPELPRERRSR